MLKMLIGSSALGLMCVSAASAQGYDPGPRPPYATGAYIGIGAGEPDCSFTIAGAHAGVTVLGVNLGAGARVGVPLSCGPEPPAAYRTAYGPAPQQVYADPPQPYAPARAYGYPPPIYLQPAYGYPGGGYAQPNIYPPPPAYGYPAQPCGCEAAPYQPY